MLQAVRFAGRLKASASYHSLRASWAEARSVFFSSPLGLTTPLRADAEFCSHPIDLTHADSNAKDGLEFSLDAARSKLRRADAKLADPGSRCFSQLVGIPMALIQKI